MRHILRQGRRGLSIGGGSYEYFCKEDPSGVLGGTNNAMCPQPLKRLQSDRQW